MIAAGKHARRVRHALERYRFLDGERNPQKRRQVIADLPSHRVSRHLLVDLMSALASSVEPIRDDCVEARSGTLEQPNVSVDHLR